MFFFFAFILAYLYSLHCTICMPLSVVFSPVATHNIAICVLFYFHFFRVAARCARLLAYANKFRTACILSVDHPITQ